MKKIYMGIVGLAITALSCANYGLDKNPDRSHCFNLYFYAKKVASVNNDKRMLNKLSDENWCIERNTSLSDDISTLEKYIRKYQ